MKLKYFIRGLGIGIIFGTLIMLVAHLKSDENTLSDSQIEARASELGIVWPDEATATDALADVDSDEQPDVSELSTEIITEVKETEAEITTEADSEITTNEATTEERTTQATTEDKITEKNTYTEATITVTRGMGSTQVAELLEEAGIIDNADEFDNYLNSQGISNKIQINTFKFNSDMTYEEIAKGLTTPKSE